MIKSTLGTVVLKARAIQIYGEITNEGRAGDNVGIQLEGLSTNKIRRGFVCGNLYDDPPHEVKQITAQVYMYLCAF